MEEIPEIKHEIPRTPTGSPFVKLDLEEWNEIEESLEAFLDSDEIKPIGRTILGEWGTGKTYFQDLIKEKLEDTKNEIISTQTQYIVNAYEEAEDSKRLIKKTVREDLRFFIALFRAFKESGESFSEKIPPLDDFSNPERFVVKSLENLTEDKKKIFFFIDEIEDIAEKKEMGEKITKGIKDIVNEEDKPWGKNERFGSFIRFFLACTHDGYDRLAQNFEENIEGFEDRVEDWELPKIKKEEGIYAIRKIIEKSYEKKLSEDFNIFLSDGIPEAILKVGRGNIRNIQKLLSSLQTFSLQKGKSKWDYEILLSAFRDTKIVGLGGKTNAIKKEDLKYLQEDLSLTYKKLFQLLVCELKPFSREEIEKRIENIESLEVPGIIEEINKSLREKTDTSKEKGIVQVSHLDEDKDFEELIEILKGLVEIKEEKIIVDEDNKFSIEEFKNKFSYFDILDNKRNFFFPIEQKDIQTYFSGISDGLANAMEKELEENKILEDEIYYAISEKVSNKIFPAPVPRVLKFIIDTDERNELWREVRRNLNELYNEELDNAFFYLLNKTDGFTVEASSLEGTSLEDSKKLQKIHYDNLQDPIRTQTYIRRTNINKNFVDDIYKEFKRRIRNDKEPINLAIILHSEDISKSIRKNEMNGYPFKQFDPMYLPIKITNKMARRIIAFNKAKDKSIKINEDLYIENIKELMSRLNIEKKLNDWIEKSEKSGKIINSWRTGDVSDLVKYYNFFLNFREKITSVEEFYEKNQNKINKFRWYDKRMTHLPDLDSETPLIEKVGAMVDIGLLKKTEAGHQVSESPVEKRINKYIMSNEELGFESIQKDYLRKLFLYKNEEAEAQKLMSKYIEILERKFQITTKNNNVKKIKNEKLRNKIEDLDMQIENVRDQYEENKIFNLEYIVNEKKRDSNIVSIENMIKFLENQFEIIEMSEGEVKRSKYKMLSDTIGYLEKTFLKRYKNASRTLKKIDKNISSKTFGELKELLAHIKKQFNEEYEKKDVKEYQKIDDLMSEYKKIKETSYNKDEIEEILEEYKEREGIDKENYQKSEFQGTGSSKYKYSPRVYKFKIIQNKIEEKSKLVEESSKEIIKKIKELNQTREEIGKVKNLSFENRKISNTIVNQIKNKKEETPAITLKKMTTPVEINELSDKVSKSIEEVEEFLKPLKEAKSMIDEVSEEERKLNKKLEDFENIKNTGKTFFEGSEYIQNIKDKSPSQIDQDIDQIVDDIKSATDLNKDLFKKIREKIKELRSKAEREIKEIESFWDEESRQYQTDSYKEIVRKLDIEEEDLLNNLKRLEKIKNQDLINLDNSLQEIRKLRNDIDEKLSKYCKKEIGEEGVDSVLIELFSSDYGRLEIDKLVEKVDLEEEKLMRILEKLEEKDVLTREIKIK